METLAGGGLVAFPSETVWGLAACARSPSSVAALTVYDMVKSVDRFVTISGVRLLEKSGGQSGYWKRPAPKTDESDAEANSTKGGRSATLAKRARTPRK